MAGKRFLNPPPTVQPEWSSTWVDWLRTTYEALKTIETTDNGVGGTAFTTGMLAPTLGGTTPPVSFIFYDSGNIGNASSSATNRADPDTFDLFVLIWDNHDNTAAPVCTGRGASAAADFAADIYYKKI